MAKGAGGDGAAQFWLRDFSFAGNLEKGAAVLDGATIVAPRRGGETDSHKKRFFNISTAPIAVMKAQREIKKAPEHAVEMIEKVLEEEPYNRQANLALKDAAVAAGWPEIGVFALQTLLDENPRDVKLLHELGSFIMRRDKTKERLRFIIESPRSIRWMPRHCD